MKGVHWLDRLAHDLRGPLTPLQTAAYLLKSGQIDPKQQQELFALIERQTRVLSGMIDELGDWSQANRGVLKCGMDACDVGMLLEIASSTLKTTDGAMPSIQDDSDGAMVTGDQVRLVELLRTLTGYVMSRVPGVAPRIHVSRAGSMVQIDISARGGASVDPADIATVFEDPVPEPHDGGLGLRLLIARAIAVAHSGSLLAEALSDGGMLIRFDLPVAT
ncbi:MAG: HAMP domain-containing histidine kinase [Pseudomonadota bacterium]|nr:HAMP domain-containing histidine kinase [Pseudomonadota bacterium]